MAIPPIAPNPGEQAHATAFGKPRLFGLVALIGLLILTLVLSWTTRGAMENLASLRQRNGAGVAPDTQKTLVDLSPWQSAQTLAALAVTAEEVEYARDAERLADHEVDQAFASALRQARLRAEHRTLTGEALELSQRVAQLQQMVAQDQAMVQSLSGGSGSTAKEGAASVPASDSGDLEVAKAQLGLDSDELADAQRDLERASGDDSAQIQEKLNAHEATMKQYDETVQRGGAQIAVVSEKRHGTLAGRVKAWFNQNDRYNSIVQAEQLARQDVAKLTATHNALEAKANATSDSANASNRAAKLADLNDRSAERQILSIYDDRIQTEQQLASVYGKWAAQVQVQHRIVLHLILQSLALIIFILVCMLLSDALVRRLMASPTFDRRHIQTLRSVLEVGVQVIGVVLILLVIFGVPQETPTILGLATAALTIALQDFIIAFLGWFFLVGRNGMHVGDWVEVNGVSGIVTEVGLFYTTLLEIGSAEDKGHPTGRRITFMNGFAIRGQYFNFSTTGQWMWDEMSITIPASEDVHAVVEQIHKAVMEETEQNSRLAEQEWKRGTHGYGLSRFAATTPVVTLRPSGSGLDAQVRYVTRASERFELRNRLYQRFIDVLQNKPEPAETHGVGSS